MDRVANLLKCLGMPSSGNAGSSISISTSTSTSTSAPGIAPAPKILNMHASQRASRDESWDRITPLIARIDGIAKSLAISSLELVKVINKMALQGGTVSCQLRGGVNRDKDEACEDTSGKVLFLKANNNTFQLFAPSDQPEITPQQLSPLRGHTHALQHWERINPSAGLARGALNYNARRECLNPKVQTAIVDIINRGVDCETMIVIFSNACHHGYAAELNRMVADSCKQQQPPITIQEYCEKLSLQEHLKEDGVNLSLNEAGEIVLRQAELSPDKTAVGAVSSALVVPPEAEDLIGGYCKF